MVNFTLLAGGYAIGSSSFIATYNFNSDTNDLSLVGRSTTGDSPSWISLHPTQRIL